MRWIALVLVACEGTPAIHERPPPDAIEQQAIDFITALSAHDDAKALAAVCPALKGRLDVAAIRANTFFDQVHVSVFSRSTYEGAAVVEGAVASAAGPAQLMVYLSSQHGGWCITGALVGGTPIMALK